MPSIDRRTLVRTAAWSVPAVTFATAAPAFAASATMACQVVSLDPVAGWTTSGGGVRRNVDTGWYVPGKYAPTNDGYVTSTEAAWYDYLNLPSGSFLSFANTQNYVASATGTNAMTTVTLIYTFYVQNKVTLDLGGKVLFGYGNATEGATERQYVQIDVKGLKGGDRTIAKMAPRRQSADGTVRYPNASLGMSSASAATATNHNQLKQTDAQLTSQGYSLYTPPTGTTQGRFTADFSGSKIVDDVAGQRTLQVVYTLRLPARYDNTWVNDDVILYAPTVKVNC